MNWPGFRASRPVRSFQTIQCAADGLNELLHPLPLYQEAAQMLPQSPGLVKVWCVQNPANLFPQKLAAPLLDAGDADTAEPSRPGGNVLPGRTVPDVLREGSSGMRGIFRQGSTGLLSGRRTITDI